MIGIYIELFLNIEFGIEYHLIYLQFSDLEAGNVVINIIIMSSENDWHFLFSFHMGPFSYIHIIRDFFCLSEMAQMVFWGVAIKYKSVLRYNVTKCYFVMSTAWLSLQFKNDLHFNTYHISIMFHNGYIICTLKEISWVEWMFSLSFEAHILRRSG